MAKAREANFFLQHVEKLVVAVCLLILAITVVSYPMSEPKITVGRAETDPGKIDGDLLIKAEALKGGKLAPLPPEPDYLAMQNEKMHPKAQADKYAMFPPDTVLAEREGGGDNNPLTKVKLADMAKVVLPPEKAIVKVAPELLATEPTRDVVAAHVVALYPHKEMTRLWTKALANSVASAHVAVMEVEVQRQEQLVDGSWGPEVEVKGVSRPIKDKDDQVFELTTIPEFDGTNAKDIQDAIVQYRKDSEKIKAQPDYWEVWGSNHNWMSWQIDLPWTELSDKATQGTTPGTTPRQPRTTPRTPAYPGAPGVIPSGPGGMPGGPRMPGMPGGSIYGPSGGTGPSRIRPVRPVPVRPGQPVVTPGAGTPYPTGTATETEIAPIVTPVPDWDLEWTDLDKIEVWVHDDSLEYHKTYRYRVRLKLLNPLYARPGEVDPSSDAKVLTITTPWGEWSVPASAPRQTDIFVTGSLEQQKIVSVTVFSRCQGQRVKHTFDVKVGDKIGGPAEVEVPDLADPKIMVKKEGDFSTGATLIGIDWNRKIFRDPNNLPSVEITFVDEQGQLQTRNFELDRESKEFKALETETKLIQQVAPKPVVVPTKQPPKTKKPPVGPKTPMPKTGGHGPGAPGVI